MHGPANTLDKFWLQCLFGVNSYSARSAQGCAKSTRQHASTEKDMGKRYLISASRAMNPAMLLASTWKPTRSFKSQCSAMPMGSTTPNMLQSACMRKPEAINAHQWNIALQTLAIAKNDHCLETP
jgi:hypothetical protein